jgi:hypothetical protein
MPEDSTLQKRREVREAFTSIRMIWGEIALASADLAHARKTLFDAYLAEGFTEEQALRMVAAPIFPST